MLPKNESGFTLLELLLVAALISLLASVIIVVIDPQERFRQAHDAQVKYDIGVLSRTLEAYFTDNGKIFYPQTLDDLSSELKTVPSPPPGWSPAGDGKYGYAQVGLPDPEKESVVYGRLQSQGEFNAAKENGFPSCNPTQIYWRYLTQTRSSGYYCGSTPETPS